MLKQYRLKNYHFQLVVYIIALSIIGILLIGSAKHSVQNKQIIGFIMGLTIMIVLSLVDYTFLLKFVWIYYAGMIVLLLLVLFAGDDAKGFHNLEHTHITMDIAERELSNIITPDKPREITAQLIIEVVSEHFHISVDQMISKTRSSEIARPRQIAMYLCKTMTSDSLDVIGQLLGGRDHSTIIHGIKKVTKDYEENDSTRTLIETIKKKINPN